jgi:hypothetical protein
MNSWKQNLRTHRFSFFSVILVFAGSQLALFREYSGLQRVHHSTAIVWCCEALFLLGIASLLIGKTSMLGDSQNNRDHRASMTSVGILVIFLSMVLQFDVWETIGKYSMFYQLHPSQNVSELQHK